MASRTVSLARAAPPRPLQVFCHHFGAQRRDRPDLLYSREAEGQDWGEAVSSDEGDQMQAGRTASGLNDRAQELMAEALRLLDEARQPCAAAYLAQAIDTLRLQAW